MHKGFRDTIAKLSVEDKARLLDAIYDYNCDGIEPEGCDPAAILFSCMKVWFDKGAEAYERKVEQRKAAIAARWKKKQQDTNTTDVSAETSEIRNDTTVYDRIRPNTDVYECIRTDTNNKNKNKNKNRSISTIVDNKDNITQSEIVCRAEPDVSAPYPEDIRWICEYFNLQIEALGSNISPVRRVMMNSKTHKAVRARANDFSPDEIKAAIRRALVDDHYNGRTNGWLATFDWLFLPTNFTKALNKPDNPPHYGQNTTPATASPNLRRGIEPEINQHYDYPTSFCIQPRDEGHGEPPMGDTPC